MRIALLRQRYNPFGGAERSLVRLLDGLPEFGRPLLVTRAWPGGEGFEARVCDPFFVGRLWRDLGFARRACRLLAAEPGVLVQSHERVACCDLYRAGDGVHRAWLARRRRALGPLRRLALALSPYHRYLLAAERALFASPRLRRVVCNSDMVRRDIIEHYGVPAEKLVVIRNGVDAAVFHPGLREMHHVTIRAEFGVPPEAPLYLFVGSGFERKGLAIALEALAAVPAAWLLVVGHDRRQGRYEVLARRLGVAARVRFAGGRRDVARYYGAADALVFPSLYEPFGNVVLEAMACGLPVVISSGCGNAETVRDGENGRVVAPRDAAAVAAAMQALADPATRRRQGEAARATALHFSPAREAQAYAALYREIHEELTGELSGELTGKGRTL